MLKVARELATLRRMTVAELRQRYAEVLFPVTKAGEAGFVPTTMFRWLRAWMPTSAVS